ncbi:MAG: M1 family metallopeptidase [Chloroflexales bacterium]|nr:M1 family metallopeptidase [Chloroflexales bacterium]
MLLVSLLLSACARQAPATTAAPTVAAEAATVVSTEAATVAPTEAPTVAPTAIPTDVPLAAGIGDSYYPLEGNGGYDAQHYTIDLAVDFGTNTLSGASTMQALATSDLASFDLDFLGLDVSAVMVNGADAIFSRSGQELKITPASPITAGGTFSVTVAYAGVPQPYPDPALELFPATTGWKKWGDSVIAAVGQPDGSMAWFPSNNHPSDKATYTFRITVDDPQVVVANGVLREIIPVDADTSTYVWEMAEPMATQVAMVAIGEFERFDSKAPNGVPIRNYFLKGTSQTVIDSFDVTDDMMVFVSSILGDYPFAEYGSLIVPEFINRSALETQTLSVFDDYAPDGPDQLTMVHELAHQWYGNTLSVGDWSQLWLHEGFARYFEALWLEKTQGVEAYNANIRTQYETQLGYGVQMAASQGVAPKPGQVIPPVNPGLRIIFLPTYTGGSLALHNLRMEVGDEAFFKILRTFYEEHRKKPVVTADFIATAEKVAGRDLGAVWDTWLYDDTVPADFPLLKEAYTFP